MWNHKTLTGVLVVMVLTGYGVRQANAQTSDFERRREAAPCTLELEPINDDGTLRKTTRLVDLESQHGAAPTDAAITRDLVNELFMLADFMMYCSKAVPKLKYPLAHCLYKRVLELDKENKLARESVETIESIYDSMGKPRPSSECP
jgi:hypothetical protein